MARWAYAAVPVGVVLLAGAWWTADALLAPPAPRLGPTVIVTPRPAPTAATPEPSVTTPPSDEATVVTPAPPPHAGHDDDDGDEMDDDDD